MAAMVAVDEFELSERHALEVSPRLARARRRGDRPFGWLGLSLVAVALGVLAAPTTLPRASTDLPEWAGINSFMTVFATGSTDALDLARQALKGTETWSGGDRAGTLVWISIDAQGAPASFYRQFELPGGSFLDKLEAAAYGSDWVCEQAAANEARCMALDDPEITMHIDWPAS